MKKHRGLRRYYKNLATQNDFELSGYLNRMKDPNAWFNGSHKHFDWWGFGNNSFKRRKPHLDKLFRHFEILVEACKERKTEFQLYALLLDKSSLYDAVFLHSPNPNGTEFPLTWDNLSEECTLKNNELVEYLNRLTQYDKLYGVADEPFCILIDKNSGLNKTSYRAESDSSNYPHRTLL